LFKDRSEAGTLLGRALVDGVRRPAVVLGVPRGGVVVAYEVARELGAPLDVVMARKIGLPSNPELAIGAVTEDGQVVVDTGDAGRLPVEESYLQEQAARLAAEIRRRLDRYRAARPPVDLKGKTAVVVDDGIATGMTLAAAAAGLAAREPREIVVAVPVAPPEARQRFREFAAYVCLEEPEPFYAVGQFYADFRPVSDERVVALLRDAAHNPPQPGES